MNKIKSKINLYGEIEFHKEIANKQRQYYKNHIEDTNLLKTALVLEMDFKAKIKLGLLKFFSFSCVVLSLG